MLHNKKGSALIAVYFIITILVLFSASIFMRVIAEKSVFESRRNNMYAFYLAEAGAGTAMQWLRAQASPPVTANYANPVYAPPPINYPANPALNLVAGSALVSIYADRNNPNNIINRYLIFSLAVTQDANGQITCSRQIVKEIQEESFAKYSYFSDDEHQLVWWWQRPVWFTSGSFLEGPVHTNSHYHISGDPIFDGPVSSTDNFIDYMNGGPPADNPDFRQGVTLGVPAIPVGNLNETNVKQAALSPNGLLLDGDSTVQFVSDGTMNVTNANRNCLAQNMPIPANGALYVDNGDLDVSGTLNGRMTAGTEENLIISDNILYETDPMADPTSDDMIGLVSGRDVIVSSNAPFDLSIFATIAATGVSTATGGDGSFTVESYWQGPPKGLLMIYGGLMQIRRGAVGTFNSATNQQVSGYDKDYHYDPRCRYSPPNWFPKTQDYELVSSIGR